MSERSDQEWIRLLKQNDPQAVYDLWEMLFRFATAIARRYQQSEDIGRNAAEVAYTKIRQRGLHQYRFGCPFPGYCRRIVANEILRILDKQNRLPPEMEITDLIAETVGADDPAPRAASDTVLARLTPCLEPLKARERLVIELLYIEGLLPQEVADRLDITRTYANVIAHRARTSLLDCLTRRGFQSAEDLLDL